MKTFPHYTQPDQADCGPTSLRMIAKYYGKNFSLQRLRDISGINREGVTLLGLSEAAEKVGFRTTGAQIDIDQLRDIELPVIAHWNHNHFVVLYKVKAERSKKGRRFYYVSDPSKGRIKYTEEEFTRGWATGTGEDRNKGILLMLSPTPDFYTTEGDKNVDLNLSYLLKYPIQV